MALSAVIPLRLTSPLRTSSQSLFILSSLSVKLIPQIDDMTLCAANPMTALF